jgi:hypothetical protein
VTAIYTSQQNLGMPPEHFCVLEECGAKRGGVQRVLIGGEIIVASTLEA